VRKSKYTALLSLLFAVHAFAQAPAYAPVILTQQDSSGNTVGLVMHSFLFPVTTQNPAQPGEVLTLFATGLGPTSPAVPAGTPTPSSPPVITTTTPTVTAGGQRVPVVVSELAPGAIGLYQVTFALPGGCLSGNQPLLLTIGGMASKAVTLPIASSSGPAICAAVNGASFAAGAPVSPGAIVSLFGALLASGTATAASIPLPTLLSTTSLTVNGIAAPLFFVSPTQINLQIPWETKPGAAAFEVISGSTSSGPLRFPVAAANPGIFTSGNNRAIVQNQDYSINDTGNPAAAGSYITVYLTGGGPIDNAVPTGAANPSSPLSSVTAPYSASIGGKPAKVLFLGLSPGFVGLYQANLQVPQLSSGDYPVIITVGGVSSNAPLLAVSGL
jgi:uncharacterized protein (TIGR03437 family)